MSLSIPDTHAFLSTGLTMSHPEKWLVTGASRGLGLHLSMAALKQGHSVIRTTTDIDIADKNNADFRRLGGNWLQLDVTAESTQETVEQMLQETGGIDVLCNNAGAGFSGTIEDLT